ncbi:MAG: hypothetical protein CMM01_07320 [Rhodopirellula sp.]|nr:hypothetical protein [Rhodopirellula sp.]OUX51682.1 MAG: hypothetical protein CBE43_02520 [Rhodopirellula sp. TMED283]
MTGRILSKVVYQLIVLVTAATSITLLTEEATAQTGFFTDPQTGIVYRQVSRTIEKPVFETKLSQHSEVVYRPHTIRETKPENRTVMTPVVEYKWKPKLTGRWNPFRPPSIRYEKVPLTTWVARTEVVHRTKTTTTWIPENRTLEVPTQTVRTSREHSVAYEAVGRLNSSNLPADVAARLQPLDSNTPFQNLAPPRLAVTTFDPPRIASSTVSPTTAEMDARNRTQGGMTAQNLSPSPTSRPNNTTGIANQRPLPMFR